MNEYLYHLMDSTQNVPEADKDWAKRLKEDGVFCSFCGFILKRGAIDIYLNGRALKSYAPITSASGSGIYMIRKDIVCDMGEDILVDCCYLGKVYDHKGRESETYISFVPKVAPVQIRGDTTSTQAECEVCGKFLYFPLPLNKWYVVRNTIPAAAFFPDSFEGFTCSKELGDSLKAKGYKKIGYYKIAVREVSIDGCDEKF